MERISLSEPARHQVIRNPNWSTDTRKEFFGLIRQVVAYAERRKQGY